MEQAIYVRKELDLIEFVKYVMLGCERKVLQDFRGSLQVIHNFDSVTDITKGFALLFSQYLQLFLVSLFVLQSQVGYVQSQMFDQRELYTRWKASQFGARPSNGSVSSFWCSFAEGSSFLKRRSWKLWIVVGSKQPLLGTRKFKNSDIRSFFKYDVRNRMWCWQLACFSSTLRYFL